MEEHYNTSMPPVGIKILIQYNGEYHPVIRDTWGYDGKVTLPDGTEISIMGRRWKYP